MPTDARFESSSWLIRRRPRHSLMRSPSCARASSPEAWNAPSGVSRFDHDVGGNRHGARTSVRLHLRRSHKRGRPMNTANDTTAHAVHRDPPGRAPAIRGRSCGPNLATWNATNEQEQRRLLAQHWAAEVSDAGSLAAVQGHDGLRAVVSGVHEQFPGSVFSLVGDVDSHHDQLRFQWGLGPAGDEPIVIGFDVMVLEAPRKGASSTRAVLGLDPTVTVHDCHLETEHVELISATSAQSSNERLRQLPAGLSEQPTPSGISVRELIEHVVLGNRFTALLLAGVDRHEAQTMLAGTQVGDDPVADVRGLHTAPGTGILRDLALGNRLRAQRRPSRRCLRAIPSRRPGGPLVGPPACRASRRDP